MSKPSPNAQTAILSAALGLLCCSFFAAPARADKAAVPASVKIGYFSLNQVKLGVPEAASSEVLRAQAQNQLRADVEESNKKLNKMREEKKTAEEINKIKTQMEIELAAKRHALARILQTSDALAAEKIYTAVKAVAKEKGLDLIVDLGGVFEGGQRVIENGVEVTDEILKKVQPAGDEKEKSKETATAPSGK